MYIKSLVCMIMVPVVMCTSPCSFGNSIDISNGTRDDKGVISYDKYKFDRNEYYIDNATDTVRGCICMKRTCLNKCCADGFGYNAMKKVCIEDKTEFSPPVYDQYFGLTDDKVSDLYSIYYGKPSCLENEFRILISKISNSFHLIKDGQLWVEMSNRVPSFEYHTPDTYCVDTFVYEENGVQKHELNALVCFNEDKDNHHYVLSIVCMYISCFFILLTLAVYAWLPELRNLHGKVLMGYLGSFFCAFTLLATFQLILVTKISSLGTGSCIFFTFVPYYFLEAAFFWMNVMCFDIYWTFCGKRGMSIERVSSNTRFRKYTLYAFGCPLALTILMAILEYSHLPPSDYLPNLAKLGCFLYGTSKLIYLYGPITLLLIVNLIFFVLTSIEIYRINSGMKPFLNKGKDSSTNDKTRKDTHRLLLYVKLFCVMGINWILEVISSIYPNLNNIWIYTDAYNVLVGVIIFIIFVCKKKMFNLMKKRIKHNIEERHDESNNTIRLTNSNRFKLNTKKDSIDTIQTSVTDTESIKRVKANNL